MGCDRGSHSDATGEGISCASFRRERCRAASGRSVADDSCAVWCLAGAGAGNGAGVVLVDTFSVAVSPSVQHECLDCTGTKRIAESDCVGMNSPKLSDKIPRAQGKRSKQPSQVEHCEGESELSPVRTQYNQTVTC